MKALVYNGPGKEAIEDRPKPDIAAPTDAIVKIIKTTICGTDLHILKGDVPTCVPGRILGHEGIGVVDKVGAAITAFHVGDRVIVSCISSCGKCDYCRRGMYSHCVDGGWILGNRARENDKAPGSIIANIGVHGVKADLHLEKLWDRNIAITTRLLDTVTTPMLFKTMQAHRIDPKQLITHRFKVDKIVGAYDTFGSAAKTNALKVLIEA